VLNLLQDILTTDSPSGFTAAVMTKIEGCAVDLGLACEWTVKGSLVISLEGRDAGKTIGVCAHVDTLGLMVRSVKPSGALAVTKIGGPILPTLDGEYCKIHTRAGKVYTGTILSTSPAVHVYKDANDKPRDLENLEVRLDEAVKTREDVSALGIQAGDFVCYDPKTLVTESGFIKSRFLDDKLSVGLCFGVLKYLKDNRLQPAHNVKLLISAYEEVGHGMSYIPAGVSELLAVDMGCVGDDLNGSEYAVSICAKDSSGPYDYAFTSRLAELAAAGGIAHAVDIFPFYGSDVSAARTAGHDIRGALIGPGVHASHGMERGHWLGVENTMRLLTAYLLDE